MLLRKRCHGRYSPLEPESASAPGLSPAAVLHAESTTKSAHFTVFVYLRSEKFRPEWLSYDLTVATLDFALTTNLAIIVQLTLLTGAAPSLTSFVTWAEFALCLAVPFFFSGVVVSLALTPSPYPIGKVYGADLIQSVRLPFRAAISALPKHS